MDFQIVNQMGQYVGDPTYETHESAAFAARAHIFRARGTPEALRPLFVMKCVATVSAEANGKELGRSPAPLTHAERVAEAKQLLRDEGFDVSRKK